MTTHDPLADLLLSLRSIIDAYGHEQVDGDEAMEIMIAMLIAYDEAS